MPYSHSSIERLIVTLCLEHVGNFMFSDRLDLLGKLGQFASYHNDARTQRTLAGSSPSEKCGHSSSRVCDLRKFFWQEPRSRPVPNTIAA